jgi:hypothetical protein
MIEITEMARKKIKDTLEKNPDKCFRIILEGFG